MSIRRIEGTTSIQGGKSEVKVHAVIIVISVIPCIIISSGGSSFLLFVVVFSGYP